MHICETWQRAKYTVIVYKSCGELYLIVKYTDYGHAMKAYISKIFGPNVADKHAFDLIKNLGLGCNFWTN
jgi:hypothetical protein